MGSVRRASWSQYFRYLGLNILVSAGTVLLILLIWGRRGGSPAPPPTPTLDVGALLASRVPTATATVPPSPTPVTYTVRQGDTLYSIATDLGVPLDALMAANGLTDPDRLEIGQLLNVPVVEGGATREPGGSNIAATSTPSPADAQAPKLEIRGVDGAGTLDNETVRLLNSGGISAMGGWTLDDGQGQVYPFPSGFTLYSQGVVYVHTRAGVDTPIDLYWGLTAPAWTPGKTITLRDPSGGIRSSFQIPAG